MLSFRQYLFPPVAKLSVCLIQDKGQNNWNIKVQALIVSYCFLSGLDAISASRTAHALNFKCSRMSLYTVYSILYLLYTVYRHCLKLNTRTNSIQRLCLCTYKKRCKYFKNKKISTLKKGETELGHGDRKKIKETGCANFDEKINEKCNKCNKMPKDQTD